MNELKIVYKKLKEIKPYEKNPRRNDKSVDYVARSIQEFGFKNPIIIDKDGVIVCGHTRYKASQKLELKEVPCIYADDLSEEQIKAFRLADNKVAEFAEWDFELLDSEIEDIIDLDMQDFGFIVNDIDWADVEDLSEETYKEPEKDMLECPHCHHIDSKNHFKKVKGKIEPIKVDDFVVTNATLDDIDGIKSIADSNSQMIGFVLRPALEENCNKGTLLVAKAGNDILGFCNYHARKDGINTIYEVCVDEVYRGNGIGQALIDKTPRPIRLKCPVDNASNKFYQEYGFTLVEVEEGKKRKLNVWELK